MEHEAMVPVVHPQVATIAFPVIRQFHADNRRGEILPRIEILYPDTHVA
jgi:hypothetical protein